MFATGASDAVPLQLSRGEANRSIARTRQPLVFFALDQSPRENDDAVKLGTIPCSLVGGQYYDGEVMNANAGESLALVREPYNKYDANAIRVNNTDGVQLGHIKAQQAAALAPLLDYANLHDALEITCVMACMPNNIYKVPVDVSIRATPDFAVAIGAHLHGFNIEFRDCWLRTQAAAATT
jgi:SWI/SNF-related matrix-associated actin-dependent regulator of chromatin subfamily A3